MVTFDYMKRLVSILIISIFTFLLTSSTLCESTRQIYSTVSLDNEYYAENSSIFLIGRCRTIGSDGSWVGGFYKGNMLQAGAVVDNQSYEKLNLIIYNKSIIDPQLSLMNQRDMIIYMRNVSGTFFWSCWSQTSAYKFPPLVFIRCSADKVWIYFT